jgi:SHS family lactate transporter-like MFS transporter
MRIGRRYAMILALVGAVLMVPLWAFCSLTRVVDDWCVLDAVHGAGVPGGIIPAHLSELSPDSVRGFLPGFAYQCGGSFGVLGSRTWKHFSLSTCPIPSRWR